MAETERNLRVPRRTGRSVQEIQAALKAGEKLAPEEQAVLDSFDRARERARTGIARASAPGSLDEAVRRIVREEVEAILAERGLTGRGRP